MKPACQPLQMTPSPRLKLVWTGISRRRRLEAVRKTTTPFVIAARIPSHRLSATLVEAGYLQPLILILLPIHLRTQYLVAYLPRYLPPLQRLPRCAKAAAPSRSGISLVCSTVPTSNLSDRFPPRRAPDPDCPRSPRVTATASYPPFAPYVNWHCWRSSKTYRIDSVLVAFSRCATPRSTACFHQRLLCVHRITTVPTFYQRASRPNLPFRVAQRSAESRIAHLQPLLCFATWPRRRGSPGS